MVITIRMFFLLFTFQVLLQFVWVVESCHPAMKPKPAPQTNSVQGLIKGTWFTTRGGRDIASFLGIPYAAPPVGRLRFMSPQSPDPWQGTYDATSEGHACIQPSILAGLPFMPDTFGSEDCLYLNVFSPNIDMNAKLSVVVFIHGGYFEIGFSKSFLYGPQYLLDEDVVLVTLNYRLGILGFLSLDDPALPGNLGLKDQRAALHWVRDNIRHFGGDPQKVTLFGESAGAASVHYHLMFTAKEGLFRGGICNSGSALAPWALHSHTTLQPLVDRIVRDSGCPRDPGLLVTCLRELPDHQFPRLLNQAREEESGGNSSLKRKVAMVGPVVEPDGADDAIITADPWNISWASHLPLLTGANEMEALLWLYDIHKDKTDHSFQVLNENYKEILPYNLQFIGSPNSSAEFAKKLKKFYFNDERFDRKHFNSLIQLFSDGLFNYNLAEAVKRNYGKTYVYQMNYRGSNSIVHYIDMNGYGVSHYDEMYYLFPTGNFFIHNETEADTVVSKKLVKMWTNFIKYLDPTPDGSPVHWLPVASSSIDFLNIGENGFKMDSNFFGDKLFFWEDLLLRAGTA